MKGRLTHAAIVGIISAILGGLLIYSAEPVVSALMLFYPMLYWFVCGSVFHLIDSREHKVIRTIFYTVFMNIPWYVEECMRQQNAKLLLTLIIESIVMGIIIGFVSGKLFKKAKPGHYHIA